MPHFVFVFGTLKEGFPNFRVNRGVRVPGAFITAHCFPLYLVGERYSPWLINAPGQGYQVIGQIFQVDTATLHEMDLLERINEPDGYRRIRIEVMASSTDGGASDMVFAYLKEPGQFDASSARLGPLSEYTLEHAALYRSRGLPL